MYDFLDSTGIFENPLLFDILTLYVDGHRDACLSTYRLFKYIEWFVDRLPLMTYGFSWVLKLEF